MDNYTIIQNSLICDLRLSDGAYRLNILLQSMAYGNKTTIFPSQKYMSVALGKSVRTIQRYLKELVKNGLITIRRRGMGDN